MGTFHLLNKDFLSETDYDKIIYINQIFKENDTSYVSRYYRKFGPMLRQEGYLDSNLTILNGRFSYYDDKGFLDSTGMVEHGKRSGVWNFYDDSLKLIRSSKFGHGAFVEGNFTETVSASLTEPVFGSGDSSKAWKEYLQQSIHSTQRFRSIFKTGTHPVTACFTINKEGKTVDVYLKRSSEYSADAQVFDALRRSPQWTPGSIGNRPGDFNEEQSVTFHTNPFPATDTSATPQVFIGLRTEARFPGGSSGWMQFLQTNLHTDVPIEHGAPAGRYEVIISFLVGRDGKLSEIKVLNDPGYGSAEEAIRVFKKSPGWIPATEDGIPAIYRQNQYLTFTVGQN